MLFVGDDWAEDRNKLSTPTGASTPAGSPLSLSQLSLLRHSAMRAIRRRPSIRAD
jgi:hypothetical protein